MGLYIIIMGVQGAGKGVQAQFISREYGIPHISTGDLFRAMRERDGELARRVQDVMKAGQLVDDDTTSEVLRDRLEQADAAGGAIIDGYPRNDDQAQWLETYLASRGDIVAAVLLLKLDLYVAFKRAFGRVTSKSGVSYNIFFNSDGVRWAFVDHPDKQFPPRLEAVELASGESLIRRPDDANAGAIIKRIDLYLETTQPLFDYYRRKGLLVEINADRSIEDVSRSIKDAISRAGK